MPLRPWFSYVIIANDDLRLAAVFLAVSSSFILCTGQFSHLPTSLPTLRFTLVLQANTHSLLLLMNLSSNIPRSAKTNRHT